MAHEEEPWQKVLKFMAIIVTIIAVVIILRTLKGIFVPIILAIFLSYLFAPFVELLARYRIPRVLSLFILLAVISVGGTFFTQTLLRNIRAFIDYYPTMENRIVAFIADVLKRHLNLEAGNILNLLQSARVTDLLSNVVNLSFTFTGQFLLTLLFLLFIHITYGNYPKLIASAFSGRKLEEIQKIIHNINEQIINYFIVKTLISGGTGVLTGIACLLFGVKFPVLWGATAFLLNYIPYIGSMIAIAPPVLLSILQFPHSILPVILAITLIGIQLFMGNYLDPEMMGNKFNLSPIIIIFALFFWSFVWGAVGAFIAVPTMAIIKIVLQNLESTRPVAILMSKRAE
jgi:AI-2 transport protein TqsA